MRGIGLREVAQTTKISLHSLEALEGDRYEQLGGEVFVRGFLRNYARYLGLNPDDTVLRYEEYATKLKPAAPVEPPHDEPAGIFADRRNFLLIGGAMAALLAVVVLIGLLSSGKDPEPEPIRLAEFPAAATAPDETAAAMAVSAPVPAAQAAPAPQGPGFTLDIAADELSYVKLWVDADAPIERELPPGGQMRARARERIEILTGNAGGITLRVDGKPLPKLGASGRVRRRVITPQGVFPP
jgi:hypothetical protein